jgi:hypothetical protein
VSVSFVMSTTVRALQARNEAEAEEAMRAQDWYALKVEKGADGVTALKTVGKVLSNHSDVYAAQCKL